MLCSFRSPNSLCVSLWRCIPTCRSLVFPVIVPAVILFLLSSEALSALYVFVILGHFEDSVKIENLYTFGHKRNHVLHFVHGR